jgi:hypothetical protein
LYLFLLARLNMSREIKEADWKVLRRLHPLALERFCEGGYRRRDPNDCLPRRAIALHLPVRALSGHKPASGFLVAK